MSSGHHESHQGVRPDEDLSRRARRALAIHELLVDKGVLQAGEVEEQARRIQSRSLSDGSRVVARAWVDPDFKSRLLNDARSAVGELGLSLTHDAELAVMENTGSVHHLVVCTLCSCYPHRPVGTAPRLVQERRLQAAGRRRAASRDARVRARPRRGHAGAGHRQHRRPALPRAAAAAPWHGGPVRGGAGRARDPRQHGRRIGGTGPMTRRLFIDDGDVDRIDNLARVLHPPEQVPRQRRAAAGPALGQLRHPDPHHPRLGPGGAAVPHDLPGRRRGPRRRLAGDALALGADGRGELRLLRLLRGRRQLGEAGPGAVRVRRPRLGRPAPGHRQQHPAHGQGHAPGPDSRRRRPGPRAAVQGHAQTTPAPCRPPSPPTASTGATSRARPCPASTRPT